MKKKPRSRKVRMLSALLLAAAGVCLICAGSVFVSDVSARHLEDRKSYEELGAMNGDFYGWLKVGTTKIDYPVMAGEKYLRLDFHEKYRSSGSLFVLEPYRSDARVRIIYGHNMRYDNTMFGPLMRFKDEDWWRPEDRVVLVERRSDEGSESTADRAEKNYEYIEKSYQVLCWAECDKREWAYWRFDGSSSQEDMHTLLEECLEAPGERYPVESVSRRNEGDSDEPVASSASERSDCREEEAYTCDLSSLPSVISEISEVLILSTCSYHIPEPNGRFILVCVC